MGMGKRLHACSTEGAFREEYLGDLRELINRIPSRIQTHVRVPEVPRGLSELVNMRCKYHCFGVAELLSEPFRPRRCWPPIPNSSPRFARLLVELYRSLATRKSSHVFWQLLPAWRPIPLSARSLSLRRSSRFKFSIAGPLDFERLGHRDSEHECMS